jgi:hypothetical protein
VKYPNPGWILAIFSQKRNAGMLQAQHLQTNQTTGETWQLYHTVAVKRNFTCTVSQVSPVPYSRGTEWYNIQRQEWGRLVVTPVTIFYIRRHNIFSSAKLTVDTRSETKFRYRRQKRTPLDAQPKLEICLFQRGKKNASQKLEARRWCRHEIMANVTVEDLKSQYWHFTPLTLPPCP